MADRPHCDTPGQCRAIGNGHCPTCAAKARPRMVRSRDAVVRAAAAMRAHWADPEKRAELSAASRAGMDKPGVREKISAAAKARWADPEKRAAMLAAKGLAPVPGWVPGDLRGSYRGLARQHGEEEAASAIRRIKRQREKPEHQA